jgi:hypothetical protein
MPRLSNSLATILFAALALTDVSYAAAETVPHVKTSVPFHAGCAEFLKRNEITDIRDCGVSESGTFGKVDDRLYYYVLYCLIPDYSSEAAKCGDKSFTADYHSKRGLGIFVREGSSQQTQLFWESIDPDIGLYVYEKPAIVTNAFGTLMHVPVRLDGTGNGNESEYYLWSEKTREWELLDSSSWIEELQQQLPAGLSINSGVWPDIEKMTAEVPLYREDDANCCPSGGVAFVRLTLKDGRFGIKSVEFRKDNK